MENTYDEFEEVCDCIVDFEERICRCGAEAYEVKPKKQSL